MARKRTIDSRIFGPGADHSVWTGRDGFALRRRSRRDLDRESGLLRGSTRNPDAICRFANIQSRKFMPRLQKYKYK
jgi:hypothetical protein